MLSPPGCYLLDAEVNVSVRLSLNSKNLPNHKKSQTNEIQDYQKSNDKNKTEVNDCKSAWNKFVHSIWIGTSGVYVHIDNYNQIHSILPNAFNLMSSLCHSILHKSFGCKQRDKQTNADRHTHSFAHSPDERHPLCIESNSPEN